MRCSVYLKKDTDGEVLRHLEYLEAEGDSKSRFFVNAAKEYLKNHGSPSSPTNPSVIDDKDLYSMMKELINEEVDDSNNPEEPSLTESDIINDKIKNIYD